MKPATLSSHDFEHVKSTVAGVVQILESKHIESRHLKFGGEGPKPEKKPRVPTDARSEFLANRAMGDWAEKKLSEAVALAFPDMKVAQYGYTNKIAAGHAGFKDHYLGGLEETRTFGKRPDLLLFPKAFSVNGDLSEQTHAETEAAVKQSFAAIEVRSSKFDAQTYMAVRQKQREDGIHSGRETPSFTVKVEDLIIVYRWMEHYRIPQSYCQVFFDSVFAINFINIFSVIASGKGYTIETPAKSQEKATIMIPITCGLQVGKAISPPKFNAEYRVTELGRYDAYVVPQDGGFILEAEKMRRVLLAE